MNIINNNSCNSNNIPIEAIVAYDDKFGIAKDGVLPWTIKEDMAFFKEKTVSNIVIMGLNTFLSIPSRFRPLKSRLNIVLTSRYAYYNDLYKGSKEYVIFTDNQYFYHQILSCPDIYTNKYKYLNNNVDKKLHVFIIGGKQVYTHYLPICSTVWVSRLKNDYDCDLFLADYAIILDDPLMYSKTIYKEYDLFTIYKYQTINTLTASSSTSSSS